VSWPAEEFAAMLRDAESEVDSLKAEIQQLEADRLEAIRLAKKTQRLRERAMDENQQLRDALQRLKGNVFQHEVPEDVREQVDAALAAVRVEER
jgi:alpha-ketoglutarate-dependent taurine dioxygenase